MSSRITHRSILSLGTNAQRGPTFGSSGPTDKLLLSGLEAGNWAACQPPIESTRSKESRGRGETVIDSGHCYVLIS
jgi:hypothetical protein